MISLHQSSQIPLLNSRLALFLQCVNLLTFFSSKKFLSRHYLPLPPVIVLWGRSKNVDKWISTDSSLNPPSNESSVIAIFAFPLPPSAGEGLSLSFLLLQNLGNEVRGDQKELRVAEWICMVNSCAKDEEEDKRTCLSGISISILGEEMEVLKNVDSQVLQ